MFKYTKRLIAEIHFGCQEIKIHSRGNVEFERVIEDAEGFGGHGSMDGFRIHKIFETQRTERKRLHKEQLAAIH